jgi:hypothetical protein
VYYWPGPQQLPVHTPQITMEIYISDWIHKFQNKTGLDAKANLELYKSKRVCSVTMATKLFTGVNDTGDKLSLGELQVARDRIYNTVRPTKIEELVIVMGYINEPEPKIQLRPDRQGK